MSRIVAIFGPTASGKSAVAVALAHALNGEIVSADSMQVYRGIECLTNQPSLDQQEDIPHHLVGFLDPTSQYDVAQYACEAHAVIDAIIDRQHTPIVIGGSGLYLRAALAEEFFPPRADATGRERLQVQVEELGPVAAHARLATIDPAAAARIAPTDTRRVVRALELASLGSSLAPSGEDALWATLMRRPTRLFGLLVDRAQLHARINARTTELLDAGGIAEVAALQSQTSGLSTTARRAIGVLDVTALIDGQIDRSECERRLAARTRQYAKRQDTWMRRLEQIERIDANQPTDLVAAAIEARLADDPPIP